MVKLNNFFLGSVSILAFGAFALPALAQTKAADSSDVETVVVTGIRGEMQSAQAIKQNSDVFQDSISAEDIGALPDRSVVESIQRIPGVAINKFQASADPDHFSAEGSNVAIRGLTYVRSELNGEDTFSANGGRELSFSDIPSELLSGVDVFKSPRADMIEGGISGTVNLKTRLPFDSPGPVLAGSLEAAYADLADKTTPSGSILASDRWTVPFGEIGLLGAYVNSDTKSRSDNAQADYFICTGGLGNTSATCPNSFGGGQGAWFPTGANMATQYFDRKRVGYAAAAQWNSNDGTMTASLQFLQSDTQESSEEDRIELASDNVNASGEPGPLPVAGTNFGFNSQGVFTNGTITGQTGWRADGNYDWLQNDCSDSACDPRTPYWGVETNNHNRDILAKYMTNNIGFKFQWTPDDKWTFNVDAQHVESTTHDLDAQIDGATYVSTQLTLPSSGLPSFKFLPPAPPSATPVMVGGVSTAANPALGEDECQPGGGPGIAPRPQEPVASGATFANQTTCNTFMGYGHTSYADPYNTFWRDAMDHMEHSDAIESSGKLDVAYKVDGDWLSTLSAGVRWAEREEENRSTTYNWGVLSEQWGNGGPVWMSDPVDGIPNGAGATLGTPVGGGAVPTQNEKEFAFNNYFRGQISPPNSSPYLFSSINGARNYSKYAAFASEVEAEWNPNAPTGGAGGWVPLAARPGACNSAGMSGGIKVPDCEAGFLPSEVSPSNEDTQSIFFQAKFGHPTWGDQSFEGNIGLRYVNTQHETEGALEFPAANSFPLPGISQTVNSRGCLPPTTPPVAGAPAFTPAPFCLLTTAQQTAANAFSNGAFTLSTEKFSYAYLLPSFNSVYHLNDEMQVRLGASEDISRPPMGETAFNAGVLVAPDLLAAQACPPGVTSCAAQFGGFNSGTAQTGNPFLKPVRALNLDLSYEWYWSAADSFTISGFAKELHNVITQQTTEFNITNSSSGVTEPVVVTTPVNSSQVGKVKGFEVAYSQFADFLPDPFDGFGVNANFTYIDSRGVSQNIFNLLTSSGIQTVNSSIDLSKLPLEQLSKYNFNLQGIYEKGDISARIAYTWRSTFLLTGYDVIVPHSPIENAAYGSVDASFFYTINDHLKLGIEGTNLLDTVIRTEQVLTTSPTLVAPRSWFITDRTFTLTLRANL